MERASWIGSGRNNTEFTTANVAVFAAIQTAIVRTTVKVNPLSLRRERIACCRSRKADSISSNTRIERAGVAVFLSVPQQPVTERYDQYIAALPDRRSTDRLRHDTDAPSRGIVDADE